MWIIVAVVGLGLAAWHAAGGRWSSALLTVAVLAPTAWWMSPLRGGRRGSTRAQALASERSVVVYWRPGCMFCERLRRRLGADGRDAVWVDIWQDQAAAAFVRSVNDGNETVPTVVIDGVPHTNPDPDVVRTAVTAGR